MPSLFDRGRLTSIAEAKADFVSTFIVTKIAESPVPSLDRRIHLTLDTGLTHLGIREIIYKGGGIREAPEGCSLHRHRSSAKR